MRARWLGVVLAVALGCSAPVEPRASATEPDSDGASVVDGAPLDVAEPPDPGESPDDPTDPADASQQHELDMGPDPDATALDADLPEMGDSTGADAPDVSLPVCHLDADCADALPCTTDRCVAGSCQHVKQLECELCDPGAPAGDECLSTRAQHPCRPVVCDADPGSGTGVCRLLPETCVRPDSSAECRAEACEAAKCLACGTHLSGSPEAADAYCASACSCRTGSCDDSTSRCVFEAQPCTSPSPCHTAAACAPETGQCAFELVPGCEACDPAVPIADQCAETLALDPCATLYCDAGETPLGQCATAAASSCLLPDASPECRAAACDPNGASCLACGLYLHGTPSAADAWCAAACAGQTGHCNLAAQRCVFQPIYCDDGDDCTTDAYDPEAGKCSHSPTPNGVCAPCVHDADCPKSASCLVPMCWDGECVHDAHTLCVDDDPCTLDYCDADAGECRRVDLHEPPCDAPNPCSSPDECDDGNPCTFDTCDWECLHELVPCDDGSACTTSKCLGNPVWPDLSGLVNPEFGKCTHVSVYCDDGNKCTTDSCDPSSGCQFTEKVCDSGCTSIATCSPATGDCVHSPVFCCDTACVDHFWSPFKTCLAKPKSCDDGDPCTVDSCKEPLGCSSKLKVCSDDDPCTVDHCAPDTGACVFQDLGCDDADPCTLDACDPTTGACSYTDVCP